MSAVKLHLLFTFYFLKVASRDWCPWHAVFSRNHDRKLTTTGQRHTAVR